MGKKFLLLAILLFTGCAPHGLEPLREHLASFGYAMFEAPRDFNGPGTIIRFDEEGVERIVAHAGEVLPNGTVKIIKGTVKIPDYGKTVLCELKAGVYFVKAPVQLKGEYQNVHEIKMHFGPFENEVISEWALIAWLENNQEAYQRLQNGWIITDTLKSTTIDYQFISASGTTLKITLDKLPDVLGSVGLEGQWKVKDEYTLQYTGSLYLGYKRVRVTELASPSSEDAPQFEIERANSFK
ncbi:MAG: hypothetical protein HY559_05760 [Gammaproteobacteria bacterium]|nr:hypothetical protein [Gammaproteobacteria bacterium]